MLTNWLESTLRFSKLISWFIFTFLAELQNVLICRIIKITMEVKRFLVMQFDYSMEGLF